MYLKKIHIYKIGNSLSDSGFNLYYQGVREYLITYNAYSQTNS